MLNALFSFSGRIGRGRFALLTLFSVLMLVLASVSIPLMMFAFPPNWRIESEAQLLIQLASDWRGIPAALFLVTGLLSLISCCVRRLHDMGRTGWWVVLGFIPSTLIALPIAIVMSLALSLMPSRGAASAQGTAAA